MLRRNTAQASTPKMTAIIKPLCRMEDANWLEAQIFQTRMFEPFATQSAFRRIQSGQVIFR